MLFWSLLGACGSGFVRNTYAAVEGPSKVVNGVTWAWEWFSLATILVDFGYFLVKEHTWGMALDPQGSDEVNEGAPLINDNEAQYGSNEPGVPNKPSSGNCCVCM